jgi:hypothetical protein
VSARTYPWKAMLLLTLNNKITCLLVWNASVRSPWFFSCVAQRPSFIACVTLSEHQLLIMMYLTPGEDVRIMLLKMQCLWTLSGQWTWKKRKEKYN